MEQDVIATDVAHDLAAAGPPRRRGRRRSVAAANHVLFGGSRLIKPIQNSGQFRVRTTPYLVSVRCGLEGSSALAALVGPHVAALARHADAVVLFSVLLARRPLTIWSPSSNFPPPPPPSTGGRRRAPLAAKKSCLLGVLQPPRLLPTPPHHDESLALFFRRDDGARVGRDRAPVVVWMHDMRGWKDGGFRGSIYRQAER